MNKDKVKILFATAEATPFIATGGLGEVAGSLTKSLTEMYEDDTDIRIILPLYKGITDRTNFEFVASAKIPLSWRQQYCGIFKTTVNHVTYYFLDNEYYFKRDDCYGHFDDGERFAFFSKAVLYVLSIIDFMPDVIHVNDWQTALIPVYLKSKYSTYPGYDKIKSIITIHNIEYQGIYDLKIVEDVFDLYNSEISIVEYNGSVNLLKGAIESSDIVSTVSKSYSEEIFDDYFAHGLAPILKRNSTKVKGILNGIDTTFYNPETDKSLFKNYNINNLKNKYNNKTNLQRMVGLPQNVDIPVVSIISRLVKHKGMDLVTSGIEEILREKVQFIILGKGDRSYELYFKSLQERYHDKVAARIDFSSDMARKIYAGSDFLLMPSISEPCGIAQMIASRYGTVPIVRETGGLKDSIHDCSLGSGNGFTFYEQTPEKLIDTIKRALEVYKNKDDWTKLIYSVMTEDFSWNHSAKEYHNMYINLTDK
ncbi:starch synthase [Sedimentibacter acidaminivorans]|uniref:Glycogen synthase n=1 Tax=Sedimentibacter acidaminivorans TaxID=913099 RepID=A0ABS4GFH7_9FIRM|nr:glycogen synthase GlgA [Sedimentibacter acidaminivorans]MBP1926452.1 starch synthase [Sedimentibacter acidaminivorans]